MVVQGVAAKAEALAGSHVAERGAHPAHTAGEAVREAGEDGLLGTA